MSSYKKTAYWRTLSAWLILCLLSAQFTTPFFAQVARAEVLPLTLSKGTANVGAEASPSTRLIVELASPPLAVAFAEQVRAAGANAQLETNTADAQAYISQLQAEQATFLSSLQSVVPTAAASTFINESGATEQAAYQVVFNGVSVDVGSMDRAEARRQLSQMAGVKAVYLDQPYYTQLYTSTALINAPLLWNNPTIGGQQNAGAGVKVASIDGGVHKDAPMMDGTGYTYPPGYGPNGLGLTANNNGKIIVSRAYFRPWDPPAPGDENPWPGVNGTSHGMHTSSIAAGGLVTDVTYLGLEIGPMSGVAPKAYVMSYRVFYASVNGDESFYTTEGLAALEDMVMDGADVVNNSWGAGPVGGGGEFDPLDQALINATQAGVFVSMAAGNDGPGPSTNNHPSDAYINVAASSTSGTLATGKLALIVDPNLQNMPFAGANFGPAIPPVQLIDYDYLPGSVVDPTNVEGCNPWPAGAFTGKAALIQRGTCNFSIKVLNAQNGGAEFVIIYNHAVGGDDIFVMGVGDGANQVTISSIFISLNNGTALVNHYTATPATAKVRVNTIAFQQGSQPDNIIGFSSRGPGVGNVLKPDITAPGVNILAQGYTPNVAGEASHLGYGQESGTSMASPHVAGAAALVLQVHPTWSPAAVKSALMSTSKYLDIYIQDGVTPAQPLDMGAGRLDLAKAVDPGVLLSPPSLSFGLVPDGTQKTISVTVTSVAEAAETYNLSTLFTGNGFTATTALPGFAVNPTSLTLAPGESKVVNITFDSATSQGIGDNQGFIILDGPTHDAHMPAWARVSHPTTLADVLIIDNDFSDVGPKNDYDTYDYLWYYTSALEELGYTYAVVNVDLERIPDTVDLSAYRAIVWFTGDNFVQNAGLTIPQTDRLMEYLNGGGSIIAMGQDLAATLVANEADSSSAPFLYYFGLGANWLQDSVTDKFTPDSLVLPSPNAPAVFDDLAVDLTEIRAYEVGGDLSGDEEVPPVVTETIGDFTFYLDVDAQYIEFEVTIIPTETTQITITGVTVNVGEKGQEGPAIRDLAALADVAMPVVVTDSLTLAGVITPSLTFSESVQALNNELYVNVQSDLNLDGEVRGQIVPMPLRNQAYIDELDFHSHDGPDEPNGSEGFPGKPILFYPGVYSLADGTVAMTHRSQPSLEIPGITYQGRTVYATFGLEGMNTFLSPTFGITPTTRSELLGTFLDWTWSNPPTATITSTVSSNESLQTIFTAGWETSEFEKYIPVSYRWDFGDGSPYTPPQQTPEVSHTYACGFYEVRVEITDNYGNVSIGSKNVNVDQNCTTPPLHLPQIYNNPAS